MKYRGGMWEGGGEQDGVEWGGEWDNRNSIINKYIKKCWNGKKKWNPWSSGNLLNRYYDILQKTIFYLPCLCLGEGGDCRQ